MMTPIWGRHRWRRCGCCILFFLLSLNEERKLESACFSSSAQPCLLPPFQIYDDVAAAGEWRGSDGSGKACVFVIIEEKQPQRAWSKDQIWSFNGNPKIVGRR
ncbi:unnamed protein product [Cuscuta epithymum]|uniref:Secreted protein n=1 Tax=Cuscuta epithymum TaxID=186058 RepID=A0AAV0CBS7_9ASTE|nr:unnamed protein product [Cuscuta epithymum]